MNHNVLTVLPLLLRTMAADRQQLVIHLREGCVCQAGGVVRIGVHAVEGTFQADRVDGMHNDIGMRMADFVDGTHQADLVYDMQLVDFGEGMRVDSLVGAGVQ